MSEAFVAQPMDTGYTQVPHGLWTLDMDYGAKCLLGWLHSHTPAYLAKLSVNRCETEFGGGGSVRRWLAELAEHGFLTKSKQGNRWMITLLAEPWVTLHRKARVTADPAPADSAPPAEPVENPPIRPPDPADPAPVVDHLEEHQEAPLRGPSAAVTTASCRAERDELFQAIVSACGMDYGEMTKRQQRSCAVAMAELAAVGATPGEVHRRASIYPQKYQTVLTPNALANQWAALRVEGGPPPKRAETAMDQALAMMAERRTVTHLRAVGE
jgi:hypothetical protein